MADIRSGFWGTSASRSGFAPWSVVMTLDELFVSHSAIHDKDQIFAVKTVEVPYFKDGMEIE